MHTLAHKLRSVMAVKLKDDGSNTTAEQALWELDKLQVGERVVRGNEIHAVRKLTKMDDPTASIIHLFSFVQETRFPGVDVGIQNTKL